MAELPGAGLPGAGLPGAGLPGAGLPGAGPPGAGPPGAGLPGAELDTAGVPFRQLLGRARDLAARPGRAILGITGPPAAGKTTLAARLRDELGDAAAYVPLDGFHLAHELLAERGMVERKGAPDTFDAAGYVALLRRLRDPAEGVVYAPRFDRAIEDSIANAIGVPPDVPLVITEGNYLLLRSGPWVQVPGLLDEVWYIELPEETRLRRLVGRHMEFGRGAAEARERATGSDQRNAVLIEASRAYASLVVSLGGS